MKKIIFLGIFSLLVQGLFAQASLEILVKDSTNLGVPGQAVEITNPKIGYSTVKISDARGKVRIDGLSTSGAYNINVKEQSFFKGGIKDNIVLISGKTTTVTIEIKEKSQQLGEAVISASRYQTIYMVNAQVASEITVEELARRLIKLWGKGSVSIAKNANQPHEAGLLKLDCTKARMLLGWSGLWDIDTTLRKVVEWYKAWEVDGNIKEITRDQITSYYLSAQNRKLNWAV